MSSRASIEVKGCAILLDEEGHLVDPDQWSPDVARVLAERDGIELSAEHWWLIEFVRTYHNTYDTPPLMRVVVAAMREERSEPSISSRDLYRLFSDNPVRQACRYGGLKKPDWCI